MDDGDRPLDAPARVYLRPIGLPVPVAYSGLAVGGGLLGAFHLGLLPVAEQHDVGLLLLVFVPTAQLLACVFAFLGRDTPVATETAVLGLAWLGTGVTLLRDRPGQTTSAFGVFAVVAAVALVSPLAATVQTRLVPAGVFAAAAAHLVVAAAYYFSASESVERAAGAVGWLLAVVALYGSVAFQLEDAQGRAVLPVLRRKRRSTTMRGQRERLDDVDRAPGVRKRF